MRKKGGKMMHVRKLTTRKLDYENGLFDLKVTINIAYMFLALCVWQDKPRGKIEVQINLTICIESTCRPVMVEYSIFLLKCYV